MCFFRAYIFYFVVAARATDVLGRRNLLGNICNCLFVFGFKTCPRWRVFSTAYQTSFITFIIYKYLRM